MITTQPATTAVPEDDQGAEIAGSSSTLVGAGALGTRGAARAAQVVAWRIQKSNPWDNELMQLGDESRSNGSQWPSGSCKFWSSKKSEQRHGTNRIQDLRTLKTIDVSENTLQAFGGLFGCCMWGVCILPPLHGTWHCLEKPKDCVAAQGPLREKANDMLRSLHHHRVSWCSQWVVSAETSCRNLQSQSFPLGTFEVNECTVGK